MRRLAISSLRRQSDLVHRLRSQANLNSLAPRWLHVSAAPSKRNTRGLPDNEAYPALLPFPPSSFLLLIPLLRVPPTFTCFSPSIARPACSVPANGFDRPPPGAPCRGRGRRSIHCCRPQTPNRPPTDLWVGFSSAHHCFAAKLPCGCASFPFFFSLSLIPSCGVFFSFFLFSPHSCCFLPWRVSAAGKAKYPPTRREL